MGRKVFGLGLQLRGYEVGHSGEFCFQTKLGSAHPWAHDTADLLTLFITGKKQGDQAASAQKAQNCPPAFRERFF